MRIANGLTFKRFVMLHNLLLTVFSLYIFIGMTSAVHKHWGNSIRTSIARGYGTTKGLRHAWCDTNFDLWHGDLNYYGFLFYLSKYYEVVDTLILVIKGKRPSFLQEYHHAGAIICMWSGIRYASIPIWAFTVFNSFIHSIMYAYYFSSTIKLPFPNKLKQSLTTLQISQFILGSAIALSYLFIKAFDLTQGQYVGCLCTDGQRKAIWINVTYLAPLTYLFVQFWRQSYSKKKK
jgi:hypothetical protein